MNVLNVEPIVRKMFTKFFYSVNQNTIKILNPNLLKTAIQGIRSLLIFNIPNEILSVQC